MWSTIVEIKSRLAEMYETSHLGIKIAVLKCFQRIIQVQTRGSADPRVSTVMEALACMRPKGRVFTAHPTPQRSRSGSK